MIRQPRHESLSHSPRRVEIRAQVFDGERTPIGHGKGLLGMSFPIDFFQK